MDKKPMTEDQRKMGIGLVGAALKRLSDDDLWLLVEIVDRLRKPLATGSTPENGEAGHDSK